MRTNVKKRIKKTPGQAVVFAIAFVIIAFFSLSYVYTLAWGFIAGLNTNDGLILKPFDFPEKLLFVNYVNIFSEFVIGGVNFGMMTLNSLWLTLGGAFLEVACATGLGYVTSKYRFRGSKLIHFVALLIMMIPIYGNMPARYSLVYQLGINDSVAYLITYTSGIGFNYLMAYSFFKSVSWTYAEAGFIDGANDFVVFFRIMLPQAMGPISALFVIQCIGIWNDYQNPLLYLRNMPTLATGLYLFGNEANAAGHLELLMAGTMVSIIPILVLYFIFNKALLNETVAGGIKG